VDAHEWIAVDPFIDQPHPRLRWMGANEWTRGTMQQNLPYLLLEVHKMVSTRGQLFDSGRSCLTGTHSSLEGSLWRKERRRVIAQKGVRLLIHILILSHGSQLETHPR
jgi:hypothetical protein